MGQAYTPLQRYSHAVNRLVFIAICAASAALLSACASSRAPVPPTVLDPSATDLVAAEALPLWLGPQGPRECWMRVLPGSTPARDAGKSWHVVPVDLERDDAGRLAAFTLHWTFEGEAQPRSERRMLVSEAGDFSMSKVVQRDRSVITLFEPPVLVMPARINPGATVRQDVAVTIYELDRPKKVKDKGTASVEITYAGLGPPPASADGSTPSADDAERAGKRILRSSLLIDLSAAKSERFTERWFDASGLVRETYEEKIRVLGVTIDSTRQAMVLAGQGETTCNTEPAASPPGTSP
ncbi:MAG: hypothetical protein ACKVZJ_00210 [Phycisphaerales bacterium]